MLDTDVIFSHVFRELLGRTVTELRLLTLIWSDELIAEAERTLLKRKDLAKVAALRWIGYLRDGFPEERINLVALPANISLSRLTTGIDDHHICALAIVGRASLLLAFDRGYLDGPLGEHGIRVLDPDEQLCAVFDQEQQAILRVIRDQASVWGGGRPIDDLLEAITRAGAPEFTRKVRQALAG